MGNEGVLEDEASAGVQTTEGQIGERDSGNSKSRDHADASGYIWCVFVEPLVFRPISA